MDSGLCVITWPCHRSILLSWKTESSRTPRLYQTLPHKQTFLLSHSIPGVVPNKGTSGELRAVAHTVTPFQELIKATGVVVVSAALGSPRLCLHPICQVVADFNWETMSVERLQLLQKLAVQPHAFFPLRHGNLRSEEGENVAQTPMCCGNWICLDIRKLSLSLSLLSFFFPLQFTHSHIHCGWPTVNENQFIILHLQGKQCGRGLIALFFISPLQPLHTAQYNRQGMRGSTCLDKDGHEARSNISLDKHAPTAIQNTFCCVWSRQSARKARATRLT